MKFYALLLFLCGALTINAQIKTPAASPSATVMQEAGMTDITVEYSRPAVKGRTIFAADGLVPFGKPWRTGANQATKVTFSQPVTLGGKDVKKGSYAILTKPMADKWEFMLFPYESSNWGSYLEKTPAVTFTAPTKKTDWMTESFTIGFGDLKSNEATMMFMWDKTYVPVKIGLNTDDMAMESIEATLAGPTPRDYYLAGSYYHDSKRDLKTAYEYVHKANEMDPKFWQLRRESLILADMGKYKDAIQVANKSKEMAMKAGNDDYVRMNDASIKEWTMKGRTGDVVPARDKDGMNVKKSESLQKDVRRTANQ